jgi:hypothetical protein
VNVVLLLRILLICGVLTATVTMKTDGFLTVIIQVVYYIHMIVLIGMKNSTELCVSVLKVLLENTLVLKIMSTFVLKN